jgi:hypothetical protein
MTKKEFREQWEPVFINYNAAELYAMHVWIHTMKSREQWNQYVGKVWDAYMASQDKLDQQVAEENQPQEGQSAH